MPVSSDVVDQIASHGVLRAAINLSNFLLVTGRTEAGDPVGVAPDLASAIAERIGVPVRYVCYPKPGELADDAGLDRWDIALIGYEPARADKVVFTPAYVEIQSAYLVPDWSPILRNDEVDCPGIRIAVAARTAYGLWLDRHIQHAELVQCPSIDASFDQFETEKLDVLAGLRPRLLSDVARMPGSRILPGHFAAVQQSIGTLRSNLAAAAFLRDFVREAIGGGLVAELIARHDVVGVTIASESV